MIRSYGIYLQLHVLPGVHQFCFDRLFVPTKHQTQQLREVMSISIEFHLAFNMPSKGPYYVLASGTFFAHSERIENDVIC